MGFIIVPLLIIGLAAPSNPSAETLSNFSRFSKAIGQEIALVDRDGVVREGILTAAATDSVNVCFGSGTTTISREVVVSAERLRDSQKDGAIKGAVLGAIGGLFALQGYSSKSGALAGWAGSVAIYASIGWAFDALQTHQEPIYRAAPKPATAPKVKLSFRF